MTNNYQVKPVAGEAVAGAIDARGQEPIDMVLHCPACGKQHIDNREHGHGPYGRTVDWDDPPHRSHLCHGCGHVWRPADVPTNGVQAVKTTGKADSPFASREQSPASPDAGAGALAGPGVPDGVWEALQRMIEDGLVKGPASREDARTVMRYRDRVRFLATPASAPEATPLLMQDENSGRDGRRYNEWHASRPDARLNAREAAAGEAPEQQGEASAYLLTRPSGFAWSLMPRDITPETRAVFEADGATISPLYLAQAAPATGKVGAVVDMVLHCPKCGMQHIDGVEELPMAVPGSAAEGSAGWVNPPHRSHLCRPEDGGCGHIWRPADVPTNGVQAVRTTGKADSPVATPAPTVQAETGEAFAGLADGQRNILAVALLRFEAGPGHELDKKRAAEVRAALTAVQADKGGV